MPEIIADPLLRSCNHLFPEHEIEESQSFGPDPFLPRAREVNGRSQPRLSLAGHSLAGLSLDNIAELIEHVEGSLHR